MRQETRFACVAVMSAATLTVTLGQAQQYVYNRGPNYVNMSPSRCRPWQSGDQGNLRHEVEKLWNAASTTMTVYCPFQRRSTSYYGNTSGATNEKNVTVASIQMRANDAQTGAAVSCYPFATGFSSGLTFFGPTKYLCSTAGGCSTATNSYTGSNTLTWTNPITAQPTPNWGLHCRLPTNSILYWYEAAVTAN
jgi:hypothetical protein